jgi:tellurite resistance protein
VSNEEISIPDVQTRDFAREVINGIIREARILAECEAQWQRSLYRRIRHQQALRAVSEAIVYTENVQRTSERMLAATLRHGSPVSH